jgi:hypothetical protein
MADTPFSGRTTPRAQAGSASSLVLLVVVALLIWWQWDWISGAFGGGGKSLEVVDYRCDPQSGGMRFDGSVRNNSDKPIELKAVTAVFDSSGKKSDYRDATVRPVPLQPGQVGTFRGDTPPLPDAGSCRLDGFRDLTTGKPVGFHR